jgi:hypothetical protein
MSSALRCAWVRTAKRSRSSATSLDGAAEIPPPSGFSAASVRDGVEVRRRVDHHGGPDADPGGGRQAGQEALRDPVVLQARQLAAGAGEGDGAGQLGGQGHDEGHLVVAEVTPLALAQDQHAQHLAVLDDGRAEEAVIALLAGIVMR